ncbi:MAG: tRNA lysidine(34) synthetase TilS [Ruthenibacterium sp.]
MSDLAEQALFTVRQHQMLQNGDTVIVACSGGADSTALLYFLLSVRDLFSLTIRAAHVNHALRGQNSDADAAFVAQLCEKHHVPMDALTLTPPQNPGEEWARVERYRFFDTLAERFHAKIATAHTKSDLAETVLFNLARGANLHGAAGIPAVRGAYIRPFLAVSRADVETYLEKQNSAYVTDATNLTQQYARNRVRHTVLPALENVHPGAENALARFAADMAETAEYLDAQAAALLERAKAKVQMEKTAAYHAKILADAPAPVRKAALRMLIVPYADATAPRILCAEQMILCGKGAVQLSRTVRLSAAQGIVRITPSVLQKNTWTAPFLPGTYPMPQGGLFTVSTQSYENFINFQKSAQKHLIYCADYDIIQDNAFFRTRQPQDTFCAAGRGVTKTVKALFNENKISAEMRMQIPMLACGHVILWVAGFGFAEGLLPTSTSKTVVTITLQTEENL